MKTKLICSLALGIVLCSSIALAQIAPRPDEVQIGPLNVPLDIQGVRVNIIMTSLVSVSTSPSAISLKMRTFANLLDFQAKIGAIIDKIALPKNHCDLFVTISGKKLNYDNSAAVLTLSGDAEKWVCVPTKRVRIVSVEEKVLGMTINRHKLITDEVQIQTKLGTQPLKATIRARLEPASPTVIKVVMERPNVEPGGHPALSAIRDLLLRLFQIDVNKYFEQQLIKAIDPKILQAGIPEEFKKLNLKITKAAFVDVGSLGIEVDAEASIPPANMTDLLKEIAKRKQP